MRSTYILLMLLLPAAGAFNAFFFGSELKRFAEEVRTIASTSDIERFKAVVARQMYAALAQIVILAAPTVVFFVGIVRKVLGPGDILFIIIPSAIILLIAQHYKKIESAARELPVTDDMLRQQRDEIVNTWLKKPFPDW
jgi:hypothetical protein